jgi:hypothetical protein
MQSLTVKKDTIESLKEIFDIETNVYSVMRLIYNYKHSHSFLNFNENQHIDLMFNPWTLKISKCYIKHLYGYIHKVKYIKNS